MAIGKTNAQAGVSSGSNIYYTVTDLGLTVGSATIDQVWAALDTNEMLICPTTEFASTERPDQNLSGTMEILKGNYGYVVIHPKTDYCDFKMPLNPSTHATAPNQPSGRWFYEGLIKITISSVSSLPANAISTDFLTHLVRSDMEVVECTLSNPAAQTGDWTVTTTDGGVTVSGSISGTTDITLILGSVHD